MDSFYQAYFSVWRASSDIPEAIEKTFALLCEHFQAASCQLHVKKTSGWQCFASNVSNLNTALMLNEMEESEWLQSPTPFYHHNAWLWLPLQCQHQTIGLLTVQLQSPLKPLDPEYFLPLAVHLSAEIKHAPALECLPSANQTLLSMLQGLHDISFMLWRAKSLDDLLFTAVEQGKKVLHIDRIAIFLLSGENKMKGTYGTDIQGNTIKEDYFEAVIPPLWYTEHPHAQQGYLAIKNNTSLYHDLEPVGTGWSAYTSLWDGDRRVGWIAYDNLLTGKPLTDYHSHLLKQFSFIVSQHLVRRQAEENLSQLNNELEKRVTERTYQLQQLNWKLEHTCRQDPLTQVPNRRVFDQTLPLEWRRAKRHHLPVALLIIDVDHFKNFNDSYGHAVGDRCLKLIAKKLATQERRAGALFARYGGEEFVLLLPGQNAQAAVTAAEKTLHAVRTLQIPVDEHRTSHVTVSIGVSSLIPDNQNSADLLFNQADRALYQAKSSGRDGYVMYD
ncbi:diguanylate cyclase [Photobacterium galatheae]|uniref:GGDEF domain-containing protein n=1 Tax=Photobacterium galatheae TaxID=1654360 RepID=UPI00202D016E|nr:sensor domain-containing diguanylate cyclase [Photobacterium galatheae]MCM0147491.1 diguanylate cyclase [Photobacterium galatheae]